MTELREALIDAGAIERNTRALRQLAHTPEFIAVVKANGYGHGAVTAARAALAGGATRLGVADLAEAHELRDAGIVAPVIAWLHGQGVRFFPIVGWAERGDGRAAGHGNSVPRFHIAWGTGPGVVEPFARRVATHVATGRIRMAFGHRVDELTVEGGAVTGVRGTVLADDDAPRGVATNRDASRPFEARAQAVIVTSGGIGGDHDLVRRAWPERLGTPPTHMVSGVPAYVDGRMVPSPSAPAPA